MTPVLLILIIGGFFQISGGNTFDVLVSPLTELPGVSVLTYEVSGRSARSVREWMDEHRPVEKSTGDRHDALTQWSFVPDWQRSAGGACVASSATVRISIRIVLPDLVTRDQLWPSERAEWDRYFAVLVAHERNHARLALAGAIRMQGALRKATNCQEMALIVQQASAEVLDASVAYDRATDHGALEGAVFPLRQP